jgi:hypothetical protein
MWQLSKWTMGWIPRIVVGASFISALICAVQSVESCASFLVVYAFCFACCCYEFEAHEYSMFSTVFSAEFLRPAFDVLLLKTLQSAFTLHTLHASNAHQHREHSCHTVPVASLFGSIFSIFVFLQKALRASPASPQCRSLKALI